MRAGFAIPAGFAATLAAAAVIASLPGRAAWEWGLGLLVAVVALVGWFSVPTAVPAAAGFGWLMADGFLEDRYGVLRWHGRTDVVLLAALLGCGLGVAALREALIRGRRRAVWKSMDSELAELARPARDETGGRHG